MFTAVFQTLLGDDLPQATGLEFIPLWHSWGVRGGCLAADIEVRGDVVKLWGLLNLVGKRAIILNDDRTPVWWGVVEDVLVSRGALQDGLSIKDMYNRVRVAHSYEQLGETVTGMTDWAQDDESIRELGFVKELTETSEIDATVDLANAKRDLLLSRKGKPVPVTGEGGAGQDGPTATLRCAGDIFSFLWLYYAQDIGLLTHEAEQAIEQAVGVGFTSNRVGFAASGKISELEGRFKEFPDNGVIKVDGSDNNDRLTRIQSVDNREVVDFDASGVSFEANDDWVDLSDSALGFLEKDDWTEVTETDHNNGYWYVNDAAADHVVVRGASAITNELDPPGAIIRRGTYLETTSLLNHERPGLGTVTITYYGQVITQAFQISGETGWTLDAIELRLGRHGMPTDTLDLYVCANAGGYAGAVVAGPITIDPELLSEDTLNTERFEFGNTYELAPSTTYHLLIERSGDMDPENYYLVELDEAAQTGNTARLWTGAEWHGHIPDEATLSYRIMSAQETTEQIRAIVEACGQYITKVDIQTTSGIETLQWREGDLYAYDELMALLDAGIDGGTALIAEVTVDRILRITAEPPMTAEEVQQDAEGKWLDIYGRDLPAGYLPVGKWCVRGDIPSAIAAAHRMSPKLIEEMEYDCVQRKIRRVRFRGEPEIDEILGVGNG